MTERHLQGLDDAQLAAATSIGEHVGVLAGPGAGKTRTLAAHFADLHLRRRVGGHSLVCVTFTRLAAHELKTRLAAWLSPSLLQDAYIGTIHGFCVRFLQEFGATLGLSRGFGIVDPITQAEVIDEVLGDLRLKLKTKDVAAQIYAGGHDGDFRKAINEYRTRLRRANAIDLDGLIAGTLQLLRDPTPDVASRYGRRWTHVLLDEAQDTDPDQWEILRHLRPEHLYAVGDHMQSIYGFRGARPEVFAQFVNGANEVHRLGRNYRSLGPIVDIANRLTEASGSNLGLRLEPTRPMPEREGGPVEVVRVSPFEDEASQAVAVATALQQVDPEAGSVAILARTNAEITTLSQVAADFGVSVQVVSGREPEWDGTNPRAVWAALQWALNPADDVSLKYLLRWPTMRMLPNVQRNYEIDAVSNGCSLAEAILATPGKAPKAVHQMLSTLANIGSTVLDSVGHDAMQSVDYAWKVLCQWTLSEDERPVYGVGMDGTFEAVGRWMALQHRLNEPQSVSELLRWLRTRDVQDRIAMAEDAPIRAMTVHASKGLEFSRVIVLGMIDGRFPLRSADVGEERRIAYVACTRAKDALSLTYYKTRMKGPKREPAAMSPFLQEVGVQ